MNSIGSLPQTSLIPSTETQSHRWDRWILALLPLFVYLINPNSLTTPSRYIDPWLYYGYQLNLPAYVQLFDNYYYSTRLSATLPGWLAHSVLTDPIANLLVHLTLFTTCIYCLYDILKRTLHRSAALLATIALALQSDFITAVGSDYVDGWGIVYFLLAMWTVTRSVESPRWWLWHIGTGLALAALPSANILYLIWIPSVVVYCYVLRRSKGDIRPLWQVAGLQLLGFLLLLTVLGAFYYRYTGNFFYLLPSFRWSLGFYQEAGPSPYYRPFHERLPYLYWLLVPAFVLVASLFVLARAWWRGQDANTRPSAVATFFVLHFAVLFGVFAFFEFCTKSHLLQYHYQCSTLIPAASLALGVLFSLLPVQERLTYSLAILWLVLFGLLLRFAWRLTAPIQEYSVVWIFALCLLLFVVLLWVRHPRIKAILLCLIFALLNLYSLGYFLAPSPKFRPTREENLALVSATIRSIQQVDPMAHGWFWYNRDEWHGPTFGDCSAVYLCRELGDHFPMVTAKEALKAGTPRFYIVVLSSDLAVKGQAVEVLKQNGYAGTILCQTKIAHHDHSFLLFVFEANLIQDSPTSTPIQHSPTEESATRP